MNEQDIALSSWLFTAAPIIEYVDKKYHQKGSGKNRAKNNAQRPKPRKNKKHKQ
ncbi:MAG: hypothetical protein LC112_11225 [Flavobacteriales bacterium]|nr:hypothetical protein [Flavobacteriales bacterium]